MGDFNSNNDAFNRSRDAAAVQARTKAQTRASVLQLKLIGQNHPTGLTNNLLKLFEPRAPLEYKPPPEKRKCPSYTGMAQYVGKFAEPGDDEYSPPVKEGETAVQRRARVRKLRLEEGAKKAADELEKYDPSNDPNVTGDPYKTLFVARLNYETTEHRIKKEFESYGTIKRVRMIIDKVANKPRGYAFIEYTHTRDMKAAYKQADGRKLDNKRVLVDVERGRTVPNWRPRRLGGGLGSTRVGGEDVNQKFSGREPQQVASGGPSRSEEPRNREERHVDWDREKSRERGRDKDVEHEKPRERSHDKPRDRQSRDDRHRDRNRDRGRDHDHSRDRNRDRGRDSERDRDQDRERDRDRRDRPRDKDKDHERDDSELEGVRSRDKDSDYDHVESKHRRSRHSERDRDTEHESGHGYDHLEPQGDRDRYDLDAEQDRYDHMEPENYEDVRATSESRERERTRDYGRDYEQ